MLVGGLSTAALSTGDSEAQAQAMPARAYALQGNAFTNDHYLPYAGYYHAPYRAWFPLRYNHYDPQQQKYFHGGQWTEQPHQSFTNISTPLPEAAAVAVAAQPPSPPPSNSTTTTTTRSGFGSASHSWGGGWGGIGS